MDGIILKLSSSIDNIIFTPYFKVAFAIFSFFLIFFLLALVQRRYFNWTMKGAKFGFLLGALFILIVETIVITVFLFGARFLEAIGGEDKSEEMVKLTRQGVTRVNQVLGVSLCSTTPPSATSILEQLPELSKSEEDKVKAILCRQK